MRAKFLSGMILCDPNGGRVCVLVVVVVVGGVESKISVQFCPKQNSKTN